MSDTLYRKIGGRYRPVSEYEAMDHLPDGAHLVVVKPGSRSIWYDVKPDHASVLAVLKLHEDMLLQAMREAVELRAEMEPLTERQKAAWEALSASLGRPALLSYRSLMAAVDAFRRAVLEAMP